MFILFITIIKKGKGQVIGGNILLKICPNAIELLANDKETLLVSSTNGKSTITKFINKLVLSENNTTANNITGANMPSGIAYALAKQKNFNKIVLEVDEPFLPEIIKKTNTKVIVLMNLSRDQLDRGSEVKMLIKKWESSFNELSEDITIIANGDDPLISWALRNHKKTIYITGGQNWFNDSVICPICSNMIIRDGKNWKCSNCDFKKPNVVGGMLSNNSFEINGNMFNIDLKLPGPFNVSNAVISIIGTGVFLQKEKVPTAQYIKELEKVKDVDGRYIKINYKSKSLRLLLGKNPASWAELLNCINKNILVILNANTADGKDTSWIWDVPFEKLTEKFKNDDYNIYIAGTRVYDMAKRLKVAGLNIVTVNQDPLNIIENVKSDKLDVIANYTAFQNLKNKIL